jgi:adenine/guanine phosphoribosyltransferase-like PRPP-binding protein
MITKHLSGFEARGLIFGAPLALALGAAFVPLRKPGKLPGNDKEMMSMFCKTVVFKHSEVCALT